MLKTTAAGLLLLAASAPISACYVPPPHQMIQPQHLLEQSRNVFLGLVVKAELQKDGVVRYDLRVEKPFAGVQFWETVVIMGDPPPAGRGDDTYSNHYDDNFWSPESGRSYSDISCRIKPNFSVGGTYLVFLDTPYTRKSFERIVKTHGSEGVKDSWLTFVENHFKKRD